MKKRWPKVIDRYFMDNSYAKRPKSANRFAAKMKLKMGNFHRLIISKWEECGVASYDDNFDALDLRWITHDAFRSFGYLTFKNKLFIENQIMGHCKNQTKGKHLVSK